MVTRVPWVGGPPTIITAIPLVNPGKTVVVGASTRIGARRGQLQV